jgi:hypothetical protein
MLHRGAGGYPGTPVHPVQQDHSGSIRTKHRTKRPRPPPSSFITHLAWTGTRPTVDPRSPNAHSAALSDAVYGRPAHHRWPGKTARTSRPLSRMAGRYHVGSRLHLDLPPTIRDDITPAPTTHPERGAAARIADRGAPDFGSTSTRPSNALQVLFGFTPIQRLSRFPAASGADRRHASEVPLRPWDRPPATFIAPQRNRPAHAPRPHRIGLDLLLRFLHNVHPEFTGTPSEPTGGSEPTASNLLTPSGLRRYRRIAPRRLARPSRRGQQCEPNQAAVRAEQGSSPRYALKRPWITYELS